MNIFFDACVGPMNSLPVAVVFMEDAIVTLEVNAYAHRITPEQARKLGRALIKAAKFAEKGKKL